MKKTIDDRYILQQKIGQGSFGQIYIGVDKSTGEKYAIKVEEVNISVPQLIFEARIYQIMSGSTNVPRMFYQAEEEDCNVMVIELLGNSLESLLTKCNRHMSVKTVLMLAEQMISCVQFFHSKNYIHRDLKPDNFVMGKGESSNKLYIIDYGLAKRYRDQNTHQHIKFNSGKSLTGTARYASINALAGCEQSRRDDIEGLAYVLIYLCKGSLPWMGIEARDRKEKYSKICQAKRNISPEDLCSGIPHVFARFLTMAKSLAFDEEPDYAKYKSMFRNYFIENGYIFDYQYDWTEGTVISSTPSSYDLVPRRSIPRRKSQDAPSSDLKYMSVDAVRSGDYATIDSKEQKIQLPEAYNIKTIDLPKEKVSNPAKKTKKKVTKKTTKKVVKKKKKSIASRKALPNQQSAGIILFDGLKKPENIPVVNSTPNIKLIENYPPKLSDEVPVRVAKKKKSIDLARRKSFDNEISQKKEQEIAQKREHQQEIAQRRELQAEAIKRKRASIEEFELENNMRSSQRRYKSAEVTPVKLSDVKIKSHHRHHHQTLESEDSSKHKHHKHHRRQSVEPQTPEIVDTERYKTFEALPSTMKRKKRRVHQEINGLNTVDQFLLRRGAITPQNVTPVKESKKK